MELGNTEEKSITHNKTLAWKDHLGYRVIICGEVPSQPFDFQINSFVFKILSDTFSYILLCFLYF